MSSSDLKNALLVAAVIAATIYVNRSFLHLEQRLPF